MNFLVILLALFIERVLWDGHKYRQFGWFDNYLARFNGATAQAWVVNKPWGSAVIVALPLLLVGWLQTSLLPSFGDFFSVLFGLAVLLISLGPKELGQDVDRYLSARQTDNPHQIASATEAFAEHGEAGITDNPDKQVASGILVAACQRLIGPLFWFVIFGAVGALAYRLTQLMAEKSQANPQLLTLQAPSQKIAMLIDWLPARLTASGYAIAGNFDAVAAAWKTHQQTERETAFSDNQALLRETGLAALEYGTQAQPEVLVNDALALVWRNLTLWVLLLGVISLFTAL